MGQLELAFDRLAAHLVDGLGQKLRIQVKADRRDGSRLGRAEQIACAAYL